jgi:16S rRNA (cytosine967-C5)-methyltransferase
VNHPSPSASNPATPGKTHGPALWQLLQSTAEALQGVRQGQSTTRLLPKVRPAWRPAVQSLLFQVLRHLGRAQALRSCLVSRSPAPAVDALLCTALALCCDEVSTPYDNHTLVNQAVEAAKRERRTQPQAAFINACLRRFLRERDELLTVTDRDAQAQTNLPAWWLARLQQDHPEHWQRLVDHARQPAPMTLRVNAQRTTRDALASRWLSQGLVSQAVGRQGLQLQRPTDVLALPGFAEGECSVQDAAAQLAAELLWDALLGSALNTGHRPWRLLDACAAPGGKTAHLLELAPPSQPPVDLLALEIDAARLPRVQENLQRLGLQAQVRCADAGEPSSWSDGQGWDGILLDAPCTASGIVRRHPDIPWLRRASDVDQLAAQQARLLQALWPHLTPGGVMVYCTCSVFRAEGQNQIEAFLAHNTDAMLRPSPGHLMPVAQRNLADLPDNRMGDHDGFYYAVLEKQGR